VKVTLNWKDGNDEIMICDSLCHAGKYIILSHGTDMPTHIHVSDLRFPFYQVEEIRC
jgi:hypothetical protein